MHGSETRSAASALTVFVFGNPLANCPEEVLQRKFLEGTYFLLHGYPVASTCSPASLETVTRMAD